MMRVNRTHVHDVYEKIQELNYFRFGEEELFVSISTSYIRGGQTAPLRTFPCGSLRFSQNYMFVLHSLFILQMIYIL